MRKQTVELYSGVVVATRKVFGDFVTTAAPGSQGVPRTVDDIAVQPVDRQVDPDRIIFFTDGTQAHTKRDTYWTIREELP